MPKRPLFLTALVSSLVMGVWTSPVSADPRSPPGPGQAPAPAPPSVPTRGWIGVALQPVRDDLAAALHLAPGDGALVGSVMPDGPAERAGVRVGDVIIQVGSRHIRGVEDVRREIAPRASGSGVQIVLVRGSQRTTVMVLTAEAPPDEQLAPGTQDPWAGVTSGSPGGGVLQIPRWIRRPPGRNGSRRANPAPASPPSLGVTLRAVAGRPGLLVTGVAPGSLAASVSVTAGDVILEADGQPVRVPDDLRRAIADGAISLQIDRRGTRISVAVASWSAQFP